MSKAQARRAARHKLKAHDRGEDRHNKGLAMLKKRNRQNNERVARPGRPKACHYCGKDAASRDHIVPRAMMTKWHTKYDGKSLPVKNVVAACHACNSRKGASRSSCDCGTCRVAWTWYGPDGWEMLPTVDPAVGRGGHSRRDGDRAHAHDWQYDNGR